MNLSIIKRAIQYAYSHSSDEYSPSSESGYYNLFYSEEIDSEKIESASGSNERHLSRSGRLNQDHSSIGKTTDGYNS